MNKEIYDYLISHSPFSLYECQDIALEINGTESLMYIQDVLLKYMGGEDDYAYETTWELAEGIKRL